MDWKLGPENQQAREIWSSDGRVQGKHSWGGAKVFIMLGLQLQTELMDGAHPVPINSWGLPPHHPSLFSATTVSSEIGGVGRVTKGGKEKKNETGPKKEGGQHAFLLCFPTGCCCPWTAHALRPPLCFLHVPGSV